MFTSIVCVALTTSMIASHQTIDWQTDYAQARKMGQTEKKPLAVFVGNGASGFDKVCKEGTLNADLQKLLQDSYICVYVDVGTPAGQKLASDLAITRGMGLVLTDRTGGLQAFYHEGDLTTTDMSQWLKHFADPKVMVQTTLVNTSSRLSMYTPMDGNGNPVMYSTYPGSYPGMVIYGGGGCPGGNCIRR